MMMIFWLELMKIKNVQIEINFFVSYHGNNACDAASSHAKKKISEYQRDSESILSDSKQISETISFLKNHTGSAGQQVARARLKLKQWLAFHRFINLFQNLKITSTLFKLLHPLMTQCLI